VLFCLLLPASFLFLRLLAVSGEWPCRHCMARSADSQSRLDPTHILSPRTRLARYRFNAPADFRERRPAPSFCMHARTHARTGCAESFGPGPRQTPLGQIKKKKDRVMQRNCNSLTLFANGRIFAARDSCGVGGGWNRPHGPFGGRGAAFWPLLSMEEAKWNRVPARSSLLLRTEIGIGDIGTRSVAATPNCRRPRLNGLDF
jgi:hypothetical protein